MISQEADLLEAEVVWQKQMMGHDHSRLDEPIVDHHPRDGGSSSSYIRVTSGQCAVLLGTGDLGRSSTRWLYGLCSANGCDNNLTERLLSYTC
jgi:hypothetical protein